MCSTVLGGTRERDAGGERSGVRAGDRGSLRGIDRSGGAGRLLLLLLLRGRGSLRGCRSSRALPGGGRRGTRGRARRLRARAGLLVAGRA